MLTQRCIRLLGGIPGLRGQRAPRCIVINRITQLLLGLDERIAANTRTVVVIAQRQRQRRIQHSG